MANEPRIKLQVHSGVIIPSNIMPIFQDRSCFTHVMLRQMSLLYVSRQAEASATSYFLSTRPSDASVAGRQNLELWQLLKYKT